MSLKQLKVFIQDLEVGMFVSALDKPSAETPFPIQGFEIKNSADVSRVKAYCDYVYIDIEKGLAPVDIEASLGASATGVTLGRPSKTRPPPVKHRASIQSRAKIPGKSLVINPSTYKKTVELAKEIPTARKAMNNILGCLTLATRTMLREGVFDQAQLQDSVNEMVDSVIRCPDAFTWLLRLRSKDSHSHDHSVRSSLWATQFGRHIGLEVNQLKDLCLATLLKDIGRVKLDRSLLHCRNRNAQQEAEYRSFVSYSTELLHKAGFDNRQVLNIIKFHCEHFDGSGFPKGCAGTRIPFLASIAGIASEFDMLCNPREAGATMAPSKATSHLYQMRSKGFSEDLVLEFIQSIGLYPAGTIVELNTGDYGMVVEQNPKARLAPRVVVFDDDEGSVDQSNCIFVDLKNNQQALERLQKFGKRRAGEVSKLAITRDIEPDSFGIEYSLLETLIARPFNAANAQSLTTQTDSPRSQGFFSALKQRFAG